MILTAIKLLPVFLADGRDALEEKRASDESGRGDERRLQDRSRELRLPGSALASLEK